MFDKLGLTAERASTIVGVALEWQTFVVFLIVFSENMILHPVNIFDSSSYTTIDMVYKFNNFMSFLITTNDGTFKSFAGIYLSGHFSTIKER